MFFSVTSPLSFVYFQGIALAEQLLKKASDTTTSGETPGLCNSTSRGFPIDLRFTTL